MNGFKNFVLGFLSALCLICVAAYLLDSTGKIDINSGINGNGVYSKVTKDKVQTVCNLLDQYYLDSDKVDETTLTNSICTGIMAGIGDDYSGYFTPEIVADRQEKLSGEYCGIGAVVSQVTSTGACYIIKTYANSPAERTGLLPGDRILSVDETPVKGLSLEGVVELVRGESGTFVELKIKRKRTVKIFSVQRDTVETPAVVSTMLSNQIGYINIDTFDVIAVEQFDKKLTEIEGADAKGLIVDLRGNGGGLLTTLLSILDRILPSDELICYTVDKQGTRIDYTTKDDTKTNLPIVILVNNKTASASEVFTGCLKDNGYASVLGSQTFGKGIVQNTFDISDGTQVKFTISKYYTPSDECIHGKGITPDEIIEGSDEIVVSSLIEENALETDPGVIRAEEILSKDTLVKQN